MERSGTVHARFWERPEFLWQTRCAAAHSTRDEGAAVALLAPQA